MSQVLTNSFLKFASADFLPSDIASLSNWYDANDEDSITKSSNRVSQWDDKKGSDDLLQATGGNQPLFVNVGQNGLHEIDFDSDRTMETSSGSTKTQPITIYMALRLPVNDTSNTRRVITGEALAGLQFVGNNSPVYILDVGGTAFNGPVGSTPDTWGLLKLFLDGADTSFFAIDEVTIATGSVGTNDLTGLNVGGQCDGPSCYYSDIIAGEICIFDGALSSEDNASMITYLSDKWDIN